MLRRTFCSALLISLFSSGASGHVDNIYTQSVQSCAQTSIITARQFDLTFYPSTNSIVFDLRGKSLRNNVRPTLNAEIVAYGKTFYNLVFDVCSVFDGGLCPLPTYNFTAVGEYVLPNNFQINLPGIAYTIPNLEAVATIRLTDQSSGDLATCLDVTLSNGWTTGYPGVAWAAGGILIAAFIAAAVHSFYPLSPDRAGPEWRFLTIIGYYQWIATCGMLSLQYPGLYQIFTLNFAWSLGLINIHPFERSFDSTRLSDGGANVTGDSFDTSSLTYSFGVPKTTLSNAVYSLPTVTDDPVSNAQRGIAQYVEQLGIPYPNTFITALVIFLLFLVVVLVLLIVFWIGLEIIIRKKGKDHDPHWAVDLRQDASYATITNLLRVLLVGIFPLFLFAFYTFRTVRTSSWAYTLLAILTLLWLLAGAIFMTIYVRRIRRTHRLEDLLFDEKHPEHQQYSRRWNTIYSEFKPAFYWFFGPYIVLGVVRAAFVAFGQGNGWVQTMSLLVLELVAFVSLCVFRPFRRKWTNALEIFLSLTRLVVICFLVVFISSLGINRFIVTGLGIANLAIQSVVVCLFFVLTMFNLGAGLLWARKKKETEQPGWSPEEATNPEMGEVLPTVPNVMDDEALYLSRPHSSGETTLNEGAAPWRLPKESETTEHVGSTPPSYPLAPIESVGSNYDFTPPRPMLHGTDSPVLDAGQSTPVDVEYESQHLLAAPIIRNEASSHVSHESLYPVYDVGQVRSAGLDHPVAPAVRPEESSDRRTDN